jgi:hypothetical protein
MIAAAIILRIIVSPDLSMAQIAPAFLVFVVCEMPALRFALQNRNLVGPTHN